MATDCKRPKVTLPHEIIIFEILSRLRVRDVCRFRCVSKSWDALISDPLFHRNHQRIHERNPLLLVTTIDGSGPRHRKITHSLLDEESKTLDPVTQCTHDLPGSTMDGVCKTEITSMGLVCTYHRNNVYVCNPVLKNGIHFVVNCSPDDSRIRVLHLALVYITSTSNYKVLRTLTEYFEVGVKFEVLTLGSNHWRAIDGPPGGALRGFHFNVGTTIDGSVYLLWHDHRWRNWIITVLDLKEEAWSVVPIPHNDHHDALDVAWIIRYLTEMGGHLCLVCWCSTKVPQAGHLIELSLLTGYDENRPIWEKGCTIDMSLVTHRLPSLVAIEQSGKIFFMNDDGIWYKLICYDPKDRTMEEIYSGQIPFMASFYVESLRSFVVKGFKNVPLQNEEWSLGQKKSNKKPTCQTSCEYPTFIPLPFQPTTEDEE